MKSIKIEEEVWTQIGEWTVAHLCFMLNFKGKWCYKSEAYTNTVRDLLHISCY